MIRLWGMGGSRSWRMVMTLLRANGARRSWNRMVDSSLQISQVIWLPDTTWFDQSYCPSMNPIRYLQILNSMLDVRRYFSVPLVLRCQRIRSASQGTSRSLTHQSSSTSTNQNGHTQCQGQHHTSAGPLLT